MLATYSRERPSPRYRELLDLYKQMHVEGETTHGKAPEETFPGKKLPIHAFAIKRLIDETGARTLLDYGCGKGQQYIWRDLRLPDGSRIESIESYWALNEIGKYDPGFEPHSRLPDKTFDGVVCTDVLEHCPESDIPWIIEEMFGYANRFVYANVACFPAKKILPNGENAHCTVRDPDWWIGLLHAIAARYPGVRYRFILETKSKWKPVLGLFGKPRKSHQVVDHAAGGEVLQAAPGE